MKKSFLLNPMFLFLVSGVIGAQSFGAETQKMCKSDPQASKRVVRCLDGSRDKQTIEGVGCEDREYEAGEDANEGAAFLKAGRDASKDVITCCSSSGVIIHPTSLVDCKGRAEISSQ